VAAGFSAYAIASGQEDDAVDDNSDDSNSVGERQSFRQQQASTPLCRVYLNS